MNLWEGLKMHNSLSHRLAIVPTLLAAVALPLAGVACSGQKSEEPTQVADQAPPPPAEGNDASQQAPPPSGTNDERRAPAPRPRTTQRRESQEPASIPEERPRRIEVPPAEPTTLAVTIPKGTSLALAFTQEISSATALAGDPVSAELKNPVIVGDRVVFPAGSRVEGKITDVKSAKKGFKDTGGALAISFHRIVAPDGHGAGISAGITKLAEGSGKKKGAIIAGSAAGAAILGKLLGKDTAGAAVVGGAVGTAVAGSTKGKEAVLAAGEEIHVELEQPAQATLGR
jgi:hypothetical protein